MRRHFFHILEIVLLPALLLTGPAVLPTAQGEPFPMAEAWLEFRNDPPFTQFPAFTRYKPDDKQRMHRARLLTDWVLNTLAEKNIRLAIVAREGSRGTQKVDETGMGHATMAVYDPRFGTWIGHHQLSDRSQKEPLGHIWRSTLLEFFFDQKSERTEALILIPEPAIRDRMYQAILSEEYKALYPTRDYNLISRYDTVDTLHCNQWLLLQLTAARIDNYDLEAVLSEIRKTFRPAEIPVNPLIWWLYLRWQDNIRPWELPDDRIVRTVTVESLYKSDFFEERLFYSDQEAD